MDIKAEDLIRKSILDPGSDNDFYPRPESRGLINLRFNENMSGGPWLRYPDDGVDALIHHYAAALEALDPAPVRTPHPGEWDRTRILITRGAIDALDLVIATFFEPGVDQLVVTPPHFEYFDRLAALHGVARRAVPLGGPRHDRLDVDRLAALPVKGVLLCNPNNPSSTMLDPGDLDRLLERFAGLVVIDEAYIEVSGRSSHRHLLAEHPNLVVVRSMSKGLGMAGLRLGAVLADPVLVSALRAARSPFAVPTPVLDCAVRELADVSALRRRIAGFMAERAWLAAELARIPKVAEVFADAAFVTIGISDAPGTAALLGRAGFDIVAEPGGWRDHLRMSVGSRQDNTRLVAALDAGSTAGPPT
ncbi:aminotransferase class I/II-fold pyridoxal phosphate-dependent enzyme [Embleya sp. AB8]|uniref:aminotransferase class I/II-fold pyridoxal phosphate-dependent enzyme n=1 Tax=Embleya sp. AB8 TaxID=3156304 RepID=UPI003C765716